MIRKLLTALAVMLAAPAQAQEAPEASRKWDVASPPGPWRDISIDTRTGTWMALDVSPDGKEIVFDLLGDLYTLPIAGGEAKPLMTGIPWEMQPKYSPNGKWIAFTSDRGGGDNVWIVNRDGSNPKQVSKETFRMLSQPDWSADSDYIVARKHFTSSRSLGAGEMWLYHRSGGGGVQLTEKRNDQKSSGDPAFSADGKYLYFTDDTTPGSTWEYNMDPNGQIYIIQRLDRETGELEPYVTGPGGAVTPTPSPDGKSLAFIRRVRGKSVIFLLDMASGKETPIFDGLDRDMQETWSVQGLYPSMSWTPDGKSLVFWAGGAIKRIDVATRAVADIPFHVRTQMKVRETVRQTVSVAPDSFHTKMVRMTRVSPDGKRVVFEALGQLWLRDMERTGWGKARQLTTDANARALYPTWTPDGKSIVFATWNDQELGAVKVMPVTGGRARTLSDKPGHYAEPVVSPDGKTVVYRRMGGGALRASLWTREAGLYKVPLAGGANTLVTKRGSQPQFARSSDRIFFNGSGEGGRRALKSISLDGKDERTHLTSQWATSFAVSPDEKWVSWTERFQAYLAPFIGTGRGVDLGARGSALPQVKMSKDAGEWLQWSGDSKALHWTLGPMLYTRPLTDSFTFVDGAPEKVGASPTPGVDIGIDQQAWKPTGRRAIVNARILTMKGGEVIERGTIVINGDRIEAIGPTAAMTLPAGTPTIDATAKTIMPGMVDVHWHGSFGSDEIIPQQSATNYASLAYGVTTVHNPSSDNSEIFAASEMQRAGLIVGPRIYSTGSILYGATSGQTAQIDNLDDALGHLRRQKQVGAISVKSYLLPRRDQRQQVIEAASQTGMMVVPEGGSLYEYDMSLIVDGHTTVEHNIPLSKIYDDVVQLWRQTGTAYTPTLIVSFGGMAGEAYWYQRDNVWEDKRLLDYVPRRTLDARSRRREIIPPEEETVVNIARAVNQLAQAGVNIEMGAHGQRDGIGAHWETWLMVEGGMSNARALETATLGGAKALGMDKDIGSLEVGKLADLVILNKNPLEAIRNSTSVNMTMVGGRLFDTDMNEIGGKAVKKQPFWFSDEGGDVWSEGRAAAEAEALD